MPQPVTLMRFFAALVTGIALMCLAPAAPAQDGEDDPATYDRETVMDQATDFLGAGAEGVGKAVESLFQRFGRPNAYITGSEAGGGLVVGLRYGGGQLRHKIEGDRPIHWTGPSIGFDAGADAAKVFGLVYNVYDTEEVYTRIGAIEGSFYYVGGLGISVYANDTLRIAIIRLGAGLRAQATVGYMKFSKEKTYMPF
ncbi:EipA family protein [Yunchengibacter salinarum]|uniref:EipA family protein n=1 Tax=Yunchengibacter salinarum TaxID=3133399 RepID=UPI0035B5A1F6